jgi:hypothetical protein
MTAVEVTIVQPLDGATPRGASPVRLKGGVGTLPPELAGVTLYYRWYSSGSPAKEDHYSLNETALQGPAADFPAALGIGSQAITFAASDQPGQDRAAQDATSHGGVAGGSLGPKRCVIHVLRAVARRPTSGETLSRASSTLEAEAPLHWPKPEYQALNRLRYHWRFEPDPDDGRATVDLVPTVDALDFEATATGPVVRYVGPLQGADLGGYTMRLRVEDLQDSDVFDEATVPVVIGP